MRCRTPATRQVERWNSGNPFRNKPIRKIIALRRKVRSTSVRFDSPRCRRDRNDKLSDTPTIKRKNGKIRSVGVQPFQSECFNGAKGKSLPGLFTRIMAAMVPPRKTSSENRREGAEASRVGVTGASRARVDMVVRLGQTAVFIVTE